MIIIMILYAIVLYMEWRYMSHHGRKPRTFLIVLGYASASLVCLEILFYLKDQWRLKDLIETVFGPVQSWLRIKE